MYIPNTITVMVAWISFFIMPDAAPARVTLGISSLIAMVLQYGNMASSLPKVKKTQNTPDISSNRINKKS